MTVAVPENPVPALALSAGAFPADANPYVTYLAKLGSRESERTMRVCLDRMAALLTGLDGKVPIGYGRDFPWASLRQAHTGALRARMAQQMANRPGASPQPWAPAQVNKHLAALRGVLKQAWKLDQMTTDEWMKAIALDPAPGKREPVGRSISAEEFAAMLAACADDGGLIGKRDAAIIAFLHSTGLRRSEVASARREDYDAGAATMRIIGKGNKERIAFVHHGAALHLTAWLHASASIRGPLFCPVDRWGHATDRHMTDRAIADIVQRRQLQAGLAPLTPHDFRRTFAGDLLDNGADLVQVKGLLGHESADVTARYDRRPARARQAAVNRLQLPEPKHLERPA